MRSNTFKMGRRALVAGIAACSLFVTVSSASAQTGGSPPPGSESTPASSSEPAPASFPTVPGNRAKLKKNGKAIPPAGAPPAVQNAIIQANGIRKLPYRYGGGHASFSDSGYDCSGAVSYVLYAAGLLESPMPSGSFVNWGLPGKGQWITVFANGGHMYAVVAGLRWDTSAVGEPLRRGSGPRWRATKRSPKGYAVRHYDGY